MCMYKGIKMYGIYQLKTLKRVFTSAVILIHQDFYFWQIRYWYRSIIYLLWDFSSSYAILTCSTSRCMTRTTLLRVWGSFPGQFGTKVPRLTGIKWGIEQAVSVSCSYSWIDFVILTNYCHTINGLGSQVHSGCSVQLYNAN